MEQDVNWQGRTLRRWVAYGGVLWFPRMVPYHLQSNSYPEDDSDKGFIS